MRQILGLALLLTFFAFPHVGWADEPLAHELPASMASSPKSISDCKLAPTAKRENPPTKQPVCPQCCCNNVPSQAVIDAFVSIRSSSESLAEIRQELRAASEASRIREIKDAKCTPVFISRENPEDNRPGRTLEYTKTILDFFKEIAWPLVISGMLILFGNKFTLVLPDILPHIREFSVKDYVTIKFGETLANAEKHIGSEPKAGEEAPIMTPDEIFDVLAKNSPSIAVLHAWMPVEAELAKIAEQTEQMIRGRSTGYIARALLKNGTLDRDSYALLEDLRVMRNAAAHGIDDSDITSEQATRFKELANVFLGLIKHSP